MSDTIRTHPRHKWVVECRGADGALKWRDTSINLTTTGGLDAMLDAFWLGNTSNPFYVGLIDATPTPAAGDTMASHAGWAEVSAEYSEATRPALTLGAVASQSIDNTASLAAFTFTAGLTIGGYMLSTDAVKGTTAGVLISVGAFTGGDRAVVDTDVVNVSLTLAIA